MPTKNQSRQDSESRKDPRIVNTLVFKLIVAMNAMVKPFAERYGRRFNISVTEWRILATIAAEPGCSGEDLGRTLCMERMTVSRAVRSLESGGNILRSADPNNKKRNHWTLTTRGWKIFDEIAPDAQRRQQRMLSELSSAEKARFSDLLDKVIAEVDRD